MLVEMWRWFLSLLVWLSASPDQLEAEAPKAAAAVAVAYASMAEEPPAPPKPKTNVITPRH